MGNVNNILLNTINGFTNGFINEDKNNKNTIYEENNLKINGHNKNFDLIVFGSIVQDLVKNI